LEAAARPAPEMAANCFLYMPHASAFWTPETLRVALGNARVMLESFPVATTEDLRWQLKILGIVLAAVRDVMGEENLAVEAGLLDQLMQKGLAAGLDVHEARALRTVLLYPPNQA